MVSVNRVDDIQERKAYSLTGDAALLLKDVLRDLKAGGRSIKTCDGRIRAWRMCVSIVLDRLLKESAKLPLSGAAAIRLVVSYRCYSGGEQRSGEAGIHNHPAGL